MGYYNWRGTGSPTLSPYVVNERTHLSGTPPYSWQPLKPAVHFANPQFEAYYNDYLRSVHAEKAVRNFKGLVEKIASNAKDALSFFLWPALCVPLLTVPWLIRKDIRGVRLWVWQIGLAFGVLLLVTWFRPHYFAPVTAAIFAVPLQGIRFMRIWQFKGRPVGIGLSRVIALFAVALAPFGLHGTTFSFQQPDTISYRVQFIHQLSELPGKHLVIVRYKPEHNVLREWIYNGADIDGSKVVWAREIPGQDIQPLLQYFKDRQIWLAQPDASPPSLTRYNASTQ